MTWKLPPWHIIYSISRRIFLLRYLIFGMGMIYIFWCVEKFMKTLQICQSFCNCIRNVYPCVTWLFYSRSLNNMIFEKYNSQVYFDAGTLYFLVLQCIHHFRSFMNSNVSRYTPLFIEMHQMFPSSLSLLDSLRWTNHTFRQFAFQPFISEEWEFMMRTWISMNFFIFKGTKLASAPSHCMFF